MIALLGILLIKKNQSKMVWLWLSATGEMSAKICHGLMETLDAKRTALEIQLSLFLTLPTKLLNQLDQLQIKNHAHLQILMLMEAHAPPKIPASAEAVALSLDAIGHGQSTIQRYGIPKTLTADADQQTTKNLQLCNSFNEILVEIY